MPKRVILGLTAKLKLLERYEFQMQYGSIDWSDGATLGYAQAVKDKRVISCIGDRSFQVTTQDISTMLRCEKNANFFMINNGGYTIEVEIHDEPYNVIKNWNYTALVDDIHNGDRKSWTTKVLLASHLGLYSLLVLRLRLYDCCNLQGYKLINFYACVTTTGSM